MKHLVVILFFALCEFGISAKNLPDPIDAANIFIETISKSLVVYIYEGLPHPAFEKDLYSQELKNGNIFDIGSYKFYNFPIIEKEIFTAKNLLGNRENLLLFRGEKMCGGFHPDYAFSWQCEKKNYFALVCLNCHEVKFIEGDKIFRYDIDEKAYNTLRTYLSNYVRNRPKIQEG